MVAEHDLSIEQATRAASLSRAAYYRQSVEWVVRDQEMIQVLNQLVAQHHSWAMDFMSDALYRGCRFRTLNVLDEGVREGLAIEVDTSLPAARVVRTLEQLA